MAICCTYAAATPPKDTRIQYPMLRATPTKPQVAPSSKVSQNPTQLPSLHYFIIE